MKFASESELMQQEDENAQDWIRSNIESSIIRMEELEADLPTIE